MAKQFANKHFHENSRAYEVWMKLRWALERHGDYIVSMANIFQLSGFSCSDALQLQSIMILGNGGMALFFLTRMPPMRVPFCWNTLKVCVNIFMVFKLTRERQPVKLTPEELEIYDEHFMPFGITARQFKKLWDLGETRGIAPGTRIVIEGECQDELMLVLTGSVSRSIHGEHIPGLDTFPGAKNQPDGDAGAWIAEIYALQMLDSVSAPESVSRDIYRRKVQQALHEPHHTEDESQIEEDLHKIEDGLRLEAADQLPMDHLMQMSVARWTVLAGEDVVVRSWKLKPLLSMSKNNTEMASVLRKALTQSTIKKILAIGSSKMPIPSGVRDPSELPTQNNFVVKMRKSLRFEKE